MSGNKLVAIDLDGTLLHSETRTVSDFNAAQIQRVIAQGVWVVLASGRAHHTIAHFAAGLGLPRQTPLIAYNGALVRTLGGETRFHQPLSPEDARKIVQFCADGGYHLNYYLNDELYVREETRWSRLYQERTGTVPHVTHDLTTLDGEQPTKLLLIDEPEVTDRLCVEFQREYGDSLYITKTEDEYLEFMAPGVSKGRALAQVAGDLGVAREDVIAFGDSYNDVPMLEWAGMGVAVGNARLPVQAVAGRVAPPADEDGVGRTLAELFPPNIP